MTPYWLNSRLSPSTAMTSSPRFLNDSQVPIRAGRADCGIATRSVAETAGLGFVPLVWERFDLVMRQRDYFLPGLQALFAFLRTEAFQVRGRELTRYDTGETGEVRQVN
jgi:molybdate-binding protein